MVTTTTLGSTPKFNIGSGNNNMSHKPNNNITSSVARKLLSSEEKEKLSVSPISGDDFPATEIVEGDSFATADDESNTD
jgi:hypothetical protein